MKPSLDGAVKNQSVAKCVEGQEPSRRVSADVCHISDPEDQSFSQTLKALRVPDAPSAIEAAGRAYISNRGGGGLHKVAKGRLITKMTLRGRVVGSKGANVEVAVIPGSG